MRHTSLAALLATAVVAGGLAATPAYARTGAEARAVWVKSCTGKDGYSRSCGRWQLIMRDGRRIDVPDAALDAVDSRGRKSAGNEAPFAISGDGRTIAYQRGRDGRLVVRAAAGGRVTVLPGAVQAGSTGTEETRLRLSPAGDRVIVEQVGDDARPPTFVVDVATGRIVRLPGIEEVEGFSADGDEVLTTRALPDNTIRLSARGLDGYVVSQVPPQVVVENRPSALAADGHTVAVQAGGSEGGSGGGAGLRVFDLETGRLSEAVALDLGKGERPYLAAWNGTDSLTVRVATQRSEEGPTTVRVLVVDVSFGTVRQKDTYKISGSAYAWYAAGE
ncbi:hypothetical protein [Streptosporangium subroseum]|uniref:hypothetical protein n=1 Tax=Streptosporangium subroseum TaxID=106412 RepID=UPI00309153F6|nr:hypothetical protein OHB15_15215 [Streptosporangium subroseum]